ncbi:hypothetical protein T4D_16117, partial [Trichinella pseudospiralis]
MEATKRIARLSVGFMCFDDFACPSCYSQGLPIPFSVDGMLLIENAYGLQMSIFGSASIGIAVIVDVMKHRLVFNPRTGSIIFRG